MSTGQFSPMFAAQTWLKRSLGQSPRLFHAVCTFSGKGGPGLVGEATDLVIEGFPRSANTFSVVAFEQMQTREFNVAHHYHSLAQVKRGIELGLPVLVLVRHPADAISSWIVRDPRVTIGAALKDYCAFYEGVLESSSQVVVGEFKRVISDFADVIAEVNRSFGSHFTTRSLNDEDKNRVFARIDQLAERQGNFDAQVARPVHGRQVQGAEIMTLLGGSRHSRMLQRAESIYSSLIAS